jgi:hypothetical protein
MNLQEELKKLEQQQQEKRAELETKYRVMQQLGVAEGYEPPMVFVHKLYGTVGSVKFDTAFAETLAKGKQPDGELLRALLEQFPPVTTVLVSDGCKSFRPDYLEVGRAEEWKGTVAEVYGVQVDVEPSTFSRTDVQFKWFAKIDGEVWRFEVVVPEYRASVGSLSIRYVRYADGEISRCESVSFSPADSNATYIKWASGSSKEPNHLTVYWDVTSGKSVDFPAYIKAAK